MPKSLPVLGSVGECPPPDPQSCSSSGPTLGKAQDKADSQRPQPRHSRGGGGVR